MSEFSNFMRVIALIVLELNENKTEVDQKIIKINEFIGFFRVENQNEREYNAEKPLFSTYDGGIYTKMPSSPFFYNNDYRSVL